MKILVCIISLFILLLSGCAANQLTAPTFESPNVCRICHQVHRPPRAERQRRVAKSLPSQQPRITQKRIKKPIKTGVSTPLFTDGFAVVSYQPYQQPIIHAAPFQITVIQLEPGEKFTNISSGDPTRWSYAVAVSGKEECAQQNVLVKPSLPEIATNLVITTDKRLYNLRLVSSQTDKPTRNVHFWYPEDIKDPKTASIEETHIEEAVNDISMNQVVHDQYRITTGGFFTRPPAWQPLRVFDDGVHTTIQFPNGICQRDLPVLFIINNGQKECVNYRFQAPFMMVDKIFHEAMLVTGVGGSQQSVILTNLSD